MEELTGKGNPGPPEGSEKPATGVPTKGVPAKKVERPAAPSTQQAQKTAEPSPSLRRRRLVWACVVAYLVTNFLMFLRFFLPRTLFEPKTKFTIGYPGDFALGVETKFQKDFRIWVVRNAERIFVIFARCTHLGCTPDWKSAETKFKCPCHGSGYDTEGVNFEGPAPRPMDRAHLELDAQGRIVVDTGVLYAWPKGLQSEFDEGDGRSGAFIQV